VYSVDQAFQRMSAKDKGWKGQEFVMEVKYDGERVQVRPPCWLICAGGTPCMTAPC
jgi:hypothetical protein